MNSLSAMRATRIDSLGVSVPLAAYSKPSMVIVVSHATVAWRTKGIDQVVRVAAMMCVAAPKAAAAVDAWSIPAGFYPIDRWPLTPNGKIDRNRLIDMAVGLTAVAR